MCIERGTPTAFWPEGGIIWQNPPRTPDPATWGDVTLTGPTEIPPVANANGPYEDDNCDYSVTFDGSGSFDSDGVIVSYDWDFGDGTGWHNGVGATPSNTYSTFGEFTVTLRVTDDDSLTDTDTTTVEIYGVDANAGGPYIIKDSLTVHLDGSGSIGYEPPLTYSWDFDDSDGIQGDSTEMSPIHTYSSYGTYTVTLTVKESGNNCEDTATSTVQFYRDPPTVNLIYPEGGETLKDTVTIEWWAHDNQDGDDLPIYLYYFDTEDNWYQINDVIENTGEYQWDTTSIPDGTYEILVEAVDSGDNIGHDRSGPFQIKNQDEPPENNPPNKPSTPSGPSFGKTGKTYSYTTMTTDPEDDQIYYKFDWDDGTNSGWIGPFSSGDTVSASHIFSAQGTYSIKVKAKDTKDAESVWSDPLSITMPRNKAVNRPLLRFLEQYLHLFPLLRQLLLRL
jgi:PKD repeat protein